MESGTYYIGDPSYIIKGNQGYLWIEKLWDEFYKDEIPAKFLNIDGISIFLGQTYGGDGIYNGFYVDSGVICVLKIDMLFNDERFSIKEMKGTKIETFNTPLLINYNEGIFNIGNLIINTKF